MTDPDRDAPGGVIGWISSLFFGRPSNSRQSAANRGWILTLSVTALLGLVLIGILSRDARSFAGGALVAVAAALAGAFLGFLFGLPRAPRPGENGDGELEVLRDSNATVVYRPNTNLDDISDWLTKILVGVGLTQIGSIPGQFERLVNFARAVLGSDANASSIVAAILIAYTVIGFMSAYIWARTRAATAFRLADEIEQQRRLSLMEERVRTIEATTAQ